MRSTRRMIVSPWLAGVAATAVLVGTNAVADPPSDGAVVTTRPAGAATQFSDQIVAGEPGDFAEVRHLVLRGPGEFIGATLARLARDRFGATTRPGPDPVTNAAQREWFREHYPAHFARMRGAAKVFGVTLTDDSVNVAGLSYAEPRAGCTVAYYPAGRMADGVAVLSRNFDFPTGTFDGRTAGPGAPVACSRPYIIESYPDGAYASLFVCAFDLLGGAIDGINEHGLTVALLADGTRPPGETLQPTRGGRPGLNEIQIVRYLLESCADAAAARSALRAARLYTTGIPCHYVIADATGDAFVWENAKDMQGGHAIEAGGDVLVSANYLAHLHSNPDALPAESHPLGSFNRVRTVRGQARGADRLTVEQVQDTACKVAPLDAATAGRSPGRTLWHAMYFPSERRLDVDFYLGEDGPRRVRRSGYKSFVLGRRP